MLHRFLAALIVLFWLVMTTLLVRNHIGAGHAGLREVPAAHVGRLIFRHEQPSDLQIYQDKRTVGHLRLQPRLDRERGLRSVEFTGNFHLVMPGVPRQRVAWDGSLEMDAAFAVVRGTLNASFRDAASSRVELTWDVPARRAEYRGLLDGQLFEQQEYTLDEQGAQAALDRLGVDRSLLASVGTIQATAAPTLRALQSSWAIHAEKVETYLLLLEHNGQTLLEVQLSQLGQVLHVKTLVGYTLAPDDLTP